MKLLVTTQSYSNDLPTPFGLLLEMNADDGHILRQLRIETPVDALMPDERVKPGLRGIVRYQGKLYVCGWNQVFVINPESFTVETTISHKWMSDLHGLYVDAAGIWVTSCLPDALILYDFEGQPRAVLWTTESCLYKDRAEIDKDMDWRQRGKGFRGFKYFHANHVTVDGDRVYLTGRGQSDDLLGDQRDATGRIACFSKQRFIEQGGLDDADITIFSRGLYGPHDGEYSAGGFWVTETRLSTACLIDNNGDVICREPVSNTVEVQKTHKPLKRLLKKLKGKKPQRRPTHWTRGLAVTDDKLYLGQSTWAGENQSQARIAVMQREPLKISHYLKLEIADYPEVRIFQILAVSQ